MEIENKGADPQELASRKYIRYDPGVESVPPNEAEDLQTVAKQINAIQEAQWNMHSRLPRQPHIFFNLTIPGHAYTGTHARTQGLVKGKLIVPEDLPKHLKQSLFEHGGKYDIVCRYSSEPGDPGLDVSSDISWLSL